MSDQNKADASMDESMLTMAVKAVSMGTREDSSSQPTIEVVKGRANKNTFQLGKERLKIGRAAYNDIVLDDTMVSRSHAEIYFEDGRYVVEDLNSTNGVCLDGGLITKAPLKSGNRISIGESELVFIQSDVQIPLSDKLNFINKSELLNWLDAETKTLLAQNLVVRFFPKDSVIIRQNTPTESMCFLYSGNIRVVEINEEGGERLIEEIGQGDFFGERALLAGESGNYSLVANSDIELLELRKDRLNELLQRKPELNQAFYRMVLTKLKSAQVKPDQESQRQDNLKHIVTPTDVQLIGEDRKIREAKKKIEQLAKEGKATLIVGAPGTGKRTFSRYFHRVGPHSDYPYVEVSITEIEESKPGAAIFGVEPDPEATHMKLQVGYLEMIGMGTLAIAHAEQLDAHQQSKLVTYLKYGWFHRVYGQKSIKSKTNVVLLASGTGADVLEKFIPELRDEFKDRIIHLPPLSQRLKDIPLLAEHYLQIFSKKNGKRVSSLSGEATEKLVSYTWPGNITELENVIQRATIVASENVIIPGDLIFVVPSEKEIHKINLLRNDELRNLFRHPLIPKIFVWFNILMVVVMAGFTLYGGSRPADHPLQSFGNNPGMLITWLIWFPILPISAALIGRIWCGVCPIAGIGDYVSKVVKFNLPVPKIFKRMDFWLVILSFLFLDYIEEFLGVAEQPWATGVLLVAIISLSVLFCILFERKTFCRYVCPLAGMLGAYSSMSMAEVRGNKKVCQTQCGQHSCYRGTENVPGCPMFSYPASLATNSQCMMCLNCLKSCDNRGVQVNIRPPLQELWRQSQPLLSLSLFGVMLVGLMARHQFPALTFWLTIAESLNWPEWMVHTVLYLFFIAIAVIPFIFSASLSAAASGERLTENMAYYGMAFIPLALSGHLAHVAHEILSEGIYDLLKYLVNLYNSIVHGIAVGTQEVMITPFIHASIVTFVKFMLISGGMLGSLIALVMIARRVSERAVLGRIIPHLMLLMFFWGAYMFIFLGSTGVPEPQASAQPGIFQTQGAVIQPQAAQTAMAITFSLTAPNIKDATVARLNSAKVSRWLKSAQLIPGTQQHRLTVNGQVIGAPPQAQVMASLEIGTLSYQFSSPIDANGNFSGEIRVTDRAQEIPLVFQIIDPATNSVISTHKILLN